MSTSRSSPRRSCSIGADAGGPRWADRRTVGIAGEDLAAGWYLSRGYEVLDRNWRCPSGELDLVARRGGAVVFCEVKARTSTRYGQPFEAVTRAKQARIRKLAARWLRERGPALGVRPARIRFDVASILGADLEVLEEAF